MRPRARVDTIEREWNPAQSGPAAMEILRALSRDRNHAVLPQLRSCLRGNPASSKSPCATRKDSGALSVTALLSKNKLPMPPNLTAAGDGHPA